MTTHLKRSQTRPGTILPCSATSVAASTQEPRRTRLVTFDVTSSRQQRRASRRTVEITSTDCAEGGIGQTVICRTEALLNAAVVSIKAIRPISSEKLSVKYLRRRRRRCTPTRTRPKADVRRWALEFDAICFKLFYLLPIDVLGTAFIGSVMQASAWNRCPHVSALPCTSPSTCA